MPGIDWTFPFAFIWGFVLVGVLAGWGTLLGAVQASDKTSPGMAAALGASIFIFLSGALLLLACFSRAFVILFIVLGAVLFVRAVLKRQFNLPRPWPENTGLRIVTALAALVVIFFYCAGPCERTVNLYDDFAAYLTFPHIMFDTGTFLDPFSERRLAALGGQSALNTMVFAVLPWKYGNLLDVGVGLLITIALVVEGVEGDSPWALLARAVLVAFATLFPITRVNFGSEYTTVMLMLALLRALDALARNESSRAKTALNVALLAGAMATLRAQNFYTVGLLLCAFFAWQLWMNRSERFSTLRLGFGTAAALLLVLFSWLALSQLSSGTFLYPLIPGNQQPRFNLFNGNQTSVGLLLFLADFFIGTKYILFIVPAFLIRDRQVRNFALLLGACIMLISVAMVIKLSSGDAPNLYRYLMPLAFGFVLYALTVVANEWITTAERRQWAMVPPLRLMAGFLVFLVICERENHGDRIFRPDLQSRFQDLAEAFKPGLDYRPLQDYTRLGFPLIPVDPESARADYARALAHVPVGASVLTDVDYPFMLDYRNYRILNVDTPGLASPPPGMPFFQGAEALKSYLLKQGIAHIAFVPSNRGISANGYPVVQYLHEKNTLLTHQFARYDNDFIKNVDALAVRNPVIYQSDYVHIISLTKPTAAP